MTRAFFIHTMGCQMNTYDSDLVAQGLIEKGWIPADDPSRADLVLVNTCTVRAKPEQKAYSLIGRLSGLKRRHPRLILGVLGCLAQMQGELLMERFPLLDLVVGPRELARVPEMVDAAARGTSRRVLIDLAAPPPEATGPDGYFQGQVTGRIAIMEGCNNFCTYCAVPYVRGREVSRSPESVVAEARHLVAEGVHDITLLGQNVNSYAWEGWDFAALLRALCERVPGLWRLRFTTSHPKDLSETLIQCFKDLPQLCHHVHLPFQAGSNRILQRMHRGYTREHYLSLVDRLRDAAPDMALSSDVMVGFPGETAQDFADTLDLIRRVEFDALFSFKYSDRAGTLAVRMEPKVPKPEKRVRLRELQALQKHITLKRNRILEGRLLEVLLEGRSKRGGTQLTGRTTTNKIVNFDLKNGKIGQLINVKIKRGFMNSLWGEPV